MPQARDGTVPTFLKKSRGIFILLGCAPWLMVHCPRNALLLKKITQKILLILLILSKTPPPLPRKSDRCGTTRSRVVIFTRRADVPVRGNPNDGLENPSSVAGAWLALFSSSTAEPPGCPSSLVPPLSPKIRRSGRSGAPSGAIENSPARHSRNQNRVSATPHRAIPGYEPAKTSTIRDSVNPRTIPSQRSGAPAGAKGNSPGQGARLRVPQPRDHTLPPTSPVRAAETPYRPPAPHFHRLRGSTMAHGSLSKKRPAPQKNHSENPVNPVKNSPAPASKI